MSIKVTAIVALILSLNLGSTTVEAESPATITVSQQSTDFRAKTFSLAKEFQAKQKRIKLKKIVTYLTTRVHKTAYVFSGSSIYGWDCSGMVRYAYKGLGITLPHSANKQAHVGTRVSKPKIGDIVVFAYQGSTNFYHSALYIGNDLIINANAMYKTTVIQPLTDFKQSQIRFVRVIK
jgi:cell wall-associated NlpC family hydrolase